MIYSNGPGRLSRSATMRRQKLGILTIRIGAFDHAPAIGEWLGAVAFAGRAGHDPDEGIATSLLAVYY
jgi:hypothetical protein